jgi:integral membrane sensor domain MASE1
MPDAVFVSALMRWTRTRSSRGASDLMDLSAVVCFAAIVSRVLGGGVTLGRKGRWCC